MGRRRRLDPQAVLDGRASPTLDDLVRLIKRVNPTGSDLPQARLAAAYATKSALQSLLIHRFGDAFEPHLPSHLREDGTVAHTVLLRHRGTGKDACHAVVDQLDDDARLWVRQRLVEQDLLRQEPASQEPPADSGASAALPSPDRLQGRGAPLLLGQEALEAYDYEEARRCFEDALIAEPRSVPAAAALLVLLVDTLGMDLDAVATGHRLQAEVRRDPAVGGLVAIAAARSGDRELARRWGRVALGDREVQVHLALAEAALRAGSLDEALDEARLVEDLDPAHPQVHRIRAGVTEQRSVERRPMEQQIQALLARGEDDQALAMARQVLQRWPRSQVARDVVQRAEALARRRARDRQIGLIEQALGTGVLDRAGRLLKELSEDDADTQRLHERLATARDEAEGARLERQVAQCEAALAAGPDAPALLAYTQLPDQQRASLRSRHPLPVLDLLESAPGLRRRTLDAIQAVLALDEARALSTSDPDGAMALLARHDRELAGMREARRVERLAQDELSRRDQSRAEAILAQAAAALARGEAEEALRLLEESPSPRDEHTREAMAETKRSAQLLHQHQVLEREWERARTEGRAVDVWRAARALARIDPTRSEAVDDAHAAVLRAWRWEQAEPEGLGLADIKLSTHEMARAQLCPEGRRLLLVDQSLNWLFLREIDAISGACLRGVSFCTPRALQLASVGWEEGRWRVLGLAGAVDIDPTTLQPTEWLDLDWLEGPSWQPDSCIPTGNPRYLWVQSCSTTGHADAIRVIDLAERRELRLLERPYFATVLSRESGPLVICFDMDGGGSTHGVRGARCRPSRFRADTILSGAAWFPQGSDLLVYGGDDVDLEMVPIRDGIQLFRVDSSGHVSPAITIPGISCERTHVLATALSQGRTYLLASADQDPRAPGISETHDGTTLFALEADEGALRLVHRRAFPSSATLVTDHHSQRVAIIWSEGAGVAVQRLDLGWPQPADDVSAWPRKWDTLFMRMPPDPLGLAGMERTQELSERLNKVPTGDLEGWLDRECRERADDPAALLTLLRAMQSSPRHHHHANELRARLHRSDGPLAPIDEIESAVKRGDWASLADQLTHIDLTGLPGLRIFETLARLGLGSPSGSVDLGGLESGHFSWRSMSKLAAALQAPEGDEPRTPWGRYVRAIRQADARLSAGEWERAWAAIDHAELWDLRDVQAAARAAKIAMSGAAETSAARLRRRRALSFFLSLLEERSLATNTPLGTHSWPPSRIDELAIEAATALESG